MGTVHFKILPKQTKIPDEPIAYLCMEKPCIDTPVVIGSLQLDDHTTRVHGGDAISVSPGGKG